MIRSKSRKLSDNLPYLFVALVITTVVFTVWSSATTIHDYLDKSKCKSKYSASELIRIYGDTQYKHTNYASNIKIVQELFTRGVIHLYGFNRIEAEQSFTVAYEQDSTCLYCAVGIVLSNGATINDPVELHHYMKARQILNHIRNNDISTYYYEDKSLLGLLQAQEIRFPLLNDTWTPIIQAENDIKYSEYLHILHQKYPMNIDIGIMYTESVLNLTPWSYFNKSSRTSRTTNSNNPKDTYSTIGKYAIHGLTNSIKIAYNIIESVLYQYPNHILALHLYIHIHEQTNQPENALWAADRLAHVMGTAGTGHLIHMPAHIYNRIGNYSEAIQSSIKAIYMDKIMIMHCMTPYAHDHNIAILVSAAMLIGDSTLALIYSPQSIIATHPWLSLYVSSLYPTPRELVYTRFGQWNDILQLHIQEYNDFYDFETKSEAEAEAESNTVSSRIPGELRLRRRRNYYHTQSIVQSSNTTSQYLEDNVVKTSKHRIMSTNAPNIDFLIQYLDDRKVSLFQQILYIYVEIMSFFHIYTPSPTGIYIDDKILSNDIHVHVHVHDRDSHHRILTNYIQIFSDLIDTIPEHIFSSTHAFYPYHKEISKILTLTITSLYSYRYIDDYQSSIRDLTQAIEIQDNFNYMEPDHYYLPIRQCLGYVYLLEVSKKEDTFLDILKNNMIIHSRNIHSTSKQMLEGTYITTSISCLNEIYMSYHTIYTLYTQDLIDHPHNIWSTIGYYQTWLQFKKFILILEPLLTSQALLIRDDTLKQIKEKLMSLLQVYTDTWLHYNIDNNWIEEKSKVLGSSCPEFSF